jgi:hypothetical protein
VPPDLCAAAPEFAATALRTVRTEFAYDLRVLYRAPGAAPERPRDRHPAFYGCYDWHSAVLMHWVLVRLLRRFPDAMPAGEIHAVLDEHLTAAAIEAETAYFAATPGFERPYGWGWALTLHEELASLAGGSPWAAARRRATAGDDGVLRLIEDVARRWFGTDTDAPVGWEPSGADFFSPALTEAVLMADVLPAGEFAPWLSAFLPGLTGGVPFEPAVVTDPTDGQGAHLHGLNLSRAWAMRRLAAALPTGDPRAAALRDSARRHAEPELAEVSGSDYMVEHWLAAYALLYLDEDC